MSLTFFFALALLMVFFIARILRQTQNNYLLSIFQFLFSFFALYGFGLYDARETIADLHGEDVLPLCFLVVLLGLGGIALGYRVFPKSRVLNWPHLRGQPQIGRLGAFGVILMVVGIAGELYFIRHSGGAQVYFSKARGAGEYETTTAYLVNLRWLWVPGIAFLAAAGTRAKKWRKTAIAGLVLLGAYNFVLGQRTGIFLTIVVTVYSLAAWRRRLPKLRTMALAITAAALMMGFLVIARADFHLGSGFSNTRKFFEQSPTEILNKALLGNIKNSGHYSSTSEIVLFAGFVRVFPQEVDFDYFKYYESLFVSWVPHIIWPTRPDPTREKVSQLLEVLGTSHRSGPTPTLLGMYYMHLGLASVFLLSILTGWFLAFVDAHGRILFLHPSAAVVFISMAGYALSMPIELGILAQLPQLLPFTVVPVVAGLLWAKAPSNKRGQVLYRAIRWEPAQTQMELMEAPGAWLAKRRRTNGGGG